MFLQVIVSDPAFNYIFSLVFVFGEKAKVTVEQGRHVFLSGSFV